MTVFANQTNSTVGRQMTATRPSFMITDILAAKVDNERAHHIPPVNHNDFDSDEDFGDDGNSSVCSNGKFIQFYFSIFVAFRRIYF